jgi:hypothetical protein|tara:strand:+ start:2201 stop:2458 length:258 start_codon:yes stop_codon:yes gene_type:complete
LSYIGNYIGNDAFLETIIIILSYFDYNGEKKETRPIRMRLVVLILRGERWHEASNCSPPTKKEKPRLQGLKCNREFLRKMPSKNT